MLAFLSKKLVIPEGITYIDSSISFTGRYFWQTYEQELLIQNGFCHDIEVAASCEHVVLPSTLRADSYFGWLHEVSKLQSITCDDRNPEIIVENNVIYSADKKRLLFLHHKWRDVEIPLTVEVVEKGALPWAYDRSRLPENAQVIE